MDNGPLPQTPKTPQRTRKGQPLGQYELVDLLGKGGMASVFRAWQPGLERWVAVKVLRAELAADANFVRRFQNEARIQAQLSHQHVVPIYEVGQAEGTYYIAMRYVPNGTLGELIQRTGPLPLERALRLLAQIADALDYAHGQGVVHRDMKPGNVLLDADDWVSLGDFGIARASEATTRLTQVGVVAGTAAYMAPEQARGEPDTGYRADLYALGVVAYELLAGRVPFTASTDVAVLHAHIYDPPPPLATLRADLPPHVDAALQVMLAKEPHDRFDSAGAFLTALAGGRAGPITRPPLQDTELYPTPPTAPVPSPPTGGRSRLPLAVGAAVLLVVVAAAAGLGGYAVLNRPASAPPPESTQVPAIAAPTLELTPAPVPVAVSTSAAVPTPLPTGADPTSLCRADIARIDPLWGSDWAGVIGVLEASRARDPSCPDVADKLYSAYLSQAAGLLSQDQTDLAIGNLDKAVQLVPGRGEAAVQRRELQLYRDGTTASKNGDLDQAIARLGELVQTDREYATGRALSTLYTAEVDRAQRYADANRLSEALKQAQDAAALEPTDDRAQSLVDSLARRVAAQATAPPRAAPPPTAVPALPALPAAGAPTDLPRLHYQAINDRRYTDGYALLSARLRTQSSLSVYQGWFVNKVSIRAENSTLVSRAANQALVEAVADSSDRIDGEVLRRRYVERFSLVFENNAWKIDAVSQVSWDPLGGQPGQAPFWTVIVASEPLRGAADDAARQLDAAGDNSGVLFSTDYASLNPNYWVAYSGRFSDKAQADAHANDLKNQGFSVAYPREVTH